MFSRSSDFAILRNLRTHGLLVPNRVDTVAFLRLTCWQSHFSLRISFSPKIYNFRGPLFALGSFPKGVSLSPRAYKTDRKNRRRDHSYLLLSFFKFNTVTFCVLSEQVFSRSSDFAILRNLRTTLFAKSGSLPVAESIQKR